VQLVESAYSSTRLTRAFFDISFLDRSTAKSIAAISGDVERRFSGTVVGSWLDFAETAINLWQEDKSRRFFLAGTCGTNPWRLLLLQQLKARGVDTKHFFDPAGTVGTWNFQHQKLEDQMRENADVELFYMGDPMENREQIQQISPYSVVEALFGLYDDPERTVIAIDYDSVNGHALEAMNKFGRDIVDLFPDAHIFASLAEAEDFFVEILGKKASAA
jgi:hypothetical protein